MNDELTPREHDAMRAALLAGSRRIKPEGRHRKQIVAGALSVLLVAVIAGGAVTAASLYGAREIQPVTTPTPTPTETASPTPSPSETEQPVGSPIGVAPFGGDCRNMLTDADVTSVWRGPMELGVTPWERGTERIQGGIQCLWLSPEEHMAARVQVTVYPEVSMDGERRANATDACADRWICPLVTVRDGMWFSVQASAGADEITETELQSLLDTAIARIGEYPAAQAAVPTASWWPVVDCDSLVAGIDPALVGYSDVARGWDPGVEPGIAAYCTFDFTNPGDPTTEASLVELVRGGGLTFDEAMALPAARPVAVDGAVAAAWLPGGDAMEGAADVFAASDGTNLLVIAPSLIEHLDGDYAPRLAAALLAVMAP